MKKFSRILMGLVLSVGAMISFASAAMADLPTSMEDYQARYAVEAKTPEGAAKLWLEGAFLYQDSSTRALGREIFLHIMKGLPKDFERNAAHSHMVDRIKNNPETQRSYCAGSSPENGYKADVNKCEITVERSVDGGENRWNLWLKSSGADMARQVTLIKDGEHWKVWSAAGLYMGIKPATNK